MMKNNKLLLKVLPDVIGPESVAEIFSREKIQHLKDNDIKTAFIISSAPVDSKTYRAMVDIFQQNRVSVMSFYFDTPDENHLDAIRNGIRDLKKALSAGGCIVIAYRSNFALAFIASLYIYNGTSPDDAISFVQRIKNDVSEVYPYKPLLKKFYEYIATPAALESGLRSASQARQHAAPAAGTGIKEEGRRAPAPQPKAPAPPAPEGQKQHQEKITEPRKSILEEEAAARRRKKQPSPAAPTFIRGAGKPGPFYQSIRFKLIFIISIMLMASLGGMIFLASYFFKNDNKIRIQESNLQLAEIVALKTKSEIEKYELISSIMLKEGRKEAILGYENLIEAGNKDVLFAGIMKKSARDNNPNFIKTFYNKQLLNKHAVSEKDIANLNDTNKATYTLSFSGENIINNISPYMNFPSFALSFPFEHDGAGNTQTILVSFIKLENLLKTFKTAGITKVWMVNYRGDVIAHPDLSLTLTGANFSKDAICTYMLKSKIDNGQTRYNDEKGVYHLGSFKKIDTSGFGIIAAAREKEAFEAVYQIQQRNMIITGMVLTCAILFIFFFGKTITSPIFRLVGATKKIIQGQYHVDIQPTSKDEIGQLTSTFIEMGKGLEEREKIKTAFGKFVNKELAEAAIKGEIGLGGERKTVAILFSDIRSFTEISENLQPEQVVEFLNAYMTKMVSCVEKMNGIVDKFIGDAIMAVWGTPISRGNDTENAINSALMMREELIKFNKERGGPGKPIIKIGVGINTGSVLAGQIGTENRMEYTVIGDPVNLASRVESLNKAFGTDILISEDSYNLTKNIFAVEKMKQIKVKGKANPQQIYTVLGRLDEEKRPRSLSELQQMLGISMEQKLSDEAMDKILDQGEEKYEIIEK